MKKQTTLFALILINLSLISTASLNKNAQFSESKQSKSGLGNGVPTAKNLKNHYGTDSLVSKYGGDRPGVEAFINSNADELNMTLSKVDLQKEFEESVVINEQMNPYKVKSGKIGNIANSTSKLVDPEIKPATLHLVADVNYPKVVEYAEFKGYKNKVKNVNVLDKKTNRISKQDVLVSEPIYERKRNVAYLPTTFEAKVNLSSNKIIQQGDSEKKLLGIDR